MNRIAFIVAVLSALPIAPACGGTAVNAAEADRIRHELRDLISAPVADRATRDAHSQYLAEAIESGALDRLEQPQIRAAIGKGRACRTDVCDRAGFGADDWYWEIGVAESDEIKQLPVLIIGFDPHGVGRRVWQLSTH